MRKAGSYEQGAASAVWLRPEELRPNPRNPRVHGAEVERLARTILRTTWGAPVVAQASTRRIIGGHGRVLAARMILAGILVEGRRLGGSTYKFSPDAPTTGVIPVRLVDVSDETADAMTLADNAQALQGVDDIDAVIALASTLSVGTLPLLDDIGISAEALAAVATLVPSATGDSPGAPKGVSAGDVRTSESLGVALGGPSRREGALTGEVRSSEDSAVATRGSSRREGYAAEWVGMPEYVNADLTPYKSVLVHFADEEAFRAFLTTTGCRVYGGINGSRTTWFPPTEDRSVGRFSDRAYTTSDE